MTLTLLPLLLSLQLGCDSKAPDGGRDSSEPPSGDADADADADADDRTVGGQTWCASGGTASDGTHTLTGCFAPVDISGGQVATDGTHTWQPGPITRIAP